ncbi:lipid II flippase MurJ [Polaribacter uvawellassae]|uniref:lipid II flippase MurJ n=1 Tax=Polaribacter uvawellassae TaxID=3133495 RepID=UPI00321B5648
MIKNILEIFFTTLLGKIFGFFKIVLLIQFFGTNALTDSVIIIISIYWFWSNIIVYSLFSVSLIPKLSKENDEKKEIFITLKTLKAVNFISLIGFVLFLVFNIHIVKLFAPSDDKLFLEYSKYFFLLLTPLVFLIPFTEIFTILNQYKKKMKTASINLTIWNLLQLISIVIVFVFFKNSFYLIYFLAYGTVIGYIVTSIIQIKASNFFKYFKLKELIQISFNETASNLSANYIYFLAILFSQLNLYIDNFFISSLDVGTISKYNIIIKVPELFQSLLISALSVVFFNKIVDDRSNVKRLFVRLSLYMIPMVFITIVFTMLYGVEFLYLIYNQDSLNNLEEDFIRNILYIIVVNIFFTIGISLLIKVYVTNNGSKVLLYSSIINVIINIIANYLLINVYGIYGIALATLISTYVLYSVLISKFFNFNKFKNSLLFLGLVLIIIICKN